MKFMSKETEQKAIKKLGQALIKIGEKSTSDCILLGVYEPKVSVELLKSMM
jgi:cyclic lactone autoinducer peptide